MGTSDSRPGKIRVNLPNGGQSGAGRRQTARSVRVSQLAQRPIRIDHPREGAEIEGTSVSLRGAASPGHSLRMEVDGLAPVSCKVKPDGSWSMAAVRLPTGAQTLTLTDLGHPDQSASLQVVITPLRAITVVAPLAGETLEARRLEVIGKAAPGHLVCLRLDRTALTERADARGSFRFRDVELANWGEQRMALYYAEDPGQGAAELAVRWPGLDLPSIVDPVTRARLEPGADVVRCAECHTYCYRLTWNRFGRCPRCGDSTLYLERSDPSFHTPRAHMAQM